MKSSIVGNKEIAKELKAKILKKGYQELHIIGHLESIVKNQPDLYYHIHDDEQIPLNVGVYVKVR
jgi:hypothetical protein